MHHSRKLGLVVVLELRYQTQLVAQQVLENLITGLHRHWVILFFEHGFEYRVCIHFAFAVFGLGLLAIQWLPKRRRDLASRYDRVKIEVLRVKLWAGIVLSIKLVDISVKAVENDGWYVTTEVLASIVKVKRIRKVHLMEVDVKDVVV